MKPGAGILTIIAATVGITQAAGITRAATTTVIPHGSIAVAGPYTIDLGEADDEKAPKAWQGPLRIAGPAGQRCTASPDVALIEGPIALVDGHLLYVPTYSGSEGTLSVVDAGTCSVRWTSPAYTGTARVTGDEVLLPGRPALTIAKDGLPVSR